MIRKTINQIQGISSSGDEFGAAMKFGVDLATSLHAISPKDGRDALHRAALLSAIQTLNLMIAASKWQCTRAAPPAEIDSTVDAKGALQGQPI
jgi:hypothetical protein